MNRILFFLAICCCACAVPTEHGFTHAGNEQSQRLSTEGSQSQQLPDTNGTIEESQSTGDSRVSEVADPDFCASGEAVALQAWESALASHPSVGHLAEIIGMFPFGGGPSGQQAVVSVDRSGKVLLWDLDRDVAFDALQLDGGVEHAAFTARLGVLALARGSAVWVYQLAQRKLLAKFDRKQATITVVRFARDGRSLLFGAADGRLYRWKFCNSDTKAGREDQRSILERYIGHGSIVSALAFHPIGRVFFSGDWKGGVFAWLPYDADRQDGFYDRNRFGPRYFADVATRTRGARQGVQSIDLLELSADGKWLAVGIEDGMIELWKVRGFRKIGEFKAHRGLIYALVVGVDGQSIVSAGRDGLVKAWKVAPESGKFQANLSLEVPIPNVRAVTFVSTKQLLAGLTDGRILEITLTTQEDNE